MDVGAAEIAVLGDADGVAASAAERLTTWLGEAVKARGEAHVALTGGSTATGLYRELRELPAEALDWSRVHLWWGDDRYVPLDHPHSNAGAAYAALGLAAAYDGSLLAAAADLPDAIMALAATDCWAEEDLSCRTAWAEDPEDFDLDDPDPDEREGGRGPFWEDVWAADERRQAINRTLADQVLLCARNLVEASGLEAAQLALHSQARTSVESLDGRQARFDLAYLAQEAAGRVRWERQAA